MTTSSRAWPVQIPKIHSMNKNPSHLAICRFLLLVLASALAGCSPIFKWHDVALDAPGVTASMTLSPGRTQRPIALDSTWAPQTLSVAICGAGDAVFSVDVVSLPTGTSAENAQRALALWEQQNQELIKGTMLKTGNAAIRGADLARRVVSYFGEGAHYATDPRHETISVFALKMSTAPRDGSNTSVPRGPVLLHARILGQPQMSDNGPSELSLQTGERFFVGLRL